MDSPPPTRSLAAAPHPRLISAAINPKFRLLALGAASGQTHVYSIDDALQPRFSHSLCADEGQSAATDAAGMLEWSPDCHALAVGHAVSGIGIWSVFGSPLLRPLQDSDASRTLTPLGCVSLSWAPEGYRLLSAPRPGVAGFGRGEMLYQSFVKSALTTCPSTSNQATVLLQGEDRLYVNPDSNSRLSDSIDKLCDSQWQSISLPPTFHLACWPLRFAVIDTTGQHIAIAGKCGMLRT